MVGVFVGVWRALRRKGGGRENGAGHRGFIVLGAIVHEKHVRPACQMIDVGQTWRIVWSGARA